MEDTIEGFVTFLTNSLYPPLLFYNRQLLTKQGLNNAATTMSYLTGALIGFIVFELYYFFRGLITAVYSKFRAPIGVPGESSIYSVCTFNDVDFFCNHMNNARYYRELDFARIDYVIRLGLSNFVSSIGDPVWIGASTIRYRRPIYLFFPYRIRTKVAYWEDHDVYFSHRFETLHDNFVRAIGYSKIVLPSMTVAEVITKADLLPPNQTSPPDPDIGLQAWIEYLSTQRQQLHEELNYTPDDATETASHDKTI